MPGLFLGHCIVGQRAEGPHLDGGGFDAGGFQCAKRTPLQHATDSSVLGSQVSFMTAGNIADITAKATSQTIVASLIGTTLGVTLCSYVGQVLSALTLEQLRPKNPTQ